MIYETKYYTIEVLTEDPDQYCYGVVNKDHGTVEHKCYTLPSAIHIADELDAQLEKLDTRSRAEVHKLKTIQ